MRSVRIALAQVNTTVGAIEENTASIIAAIEAARDAGAGIVALPELAVTGYPPEDLLLRRAFCTASRDAIDAIVPHTAGLVAIVGFVDWRESQPWNSAAVLVDGQWVDTYDKHRLPNYGVFDEYRYFSAGDRSPIYEARDATFAVAICEDIWYPGQPMDAYALAGADLCININASPFHRGKAQERARMLATRAADYRIALVYLNQVGAQDELVFDGCSMVFDADGELIARAPQFEESLTLVDIDLDTVAQSRLHDPRLRYELNAEGLPADVTAIPIDIDLARERAPEPAPVAPFAGELEEVWQALVVGTRDYFRKTGFENALLGLSGGIDSAIVAVIAADALGPEHVTGLLLPSRYSTDHSKSDAVILAEKLGIRHFTIAIEPAHHAMLEMLGEHLRSETVSMAEENMQARLRSNVWMTLSNHFPRTLVLVTGNKSEVATGYSTLYGDMAGAYAVIKDVAKTLVYDLARWRNEQAGTDLIPVSVIEKPPSAELRPDQVDEDSLPPYEILDPILEAYVEDDRSVAEIVAMGYDEATVRRIIGLVDRSEFKRRQAAPGVKITPRAFGRDRRLPLASGWKPA